MSEDKPKPCPFCGSADVRDDGDGSVYCSCFNCGAQGPAVSEYDPDAAIRRWNTRAKERGT